MDPNRGQYQGYSQSSAQYPSSGYTGQSAQSSYGSQSSSSYSYGGGSSYQDSSGRGGSYYSQPQTSGQTYPMRQQHMGGGGYNGTDAYQYGGGDYSSMQSSYSAPGSAGGRSSFRKRPRDDASRFDEPRAKRQDTRPDRSGFDASRGRGRGIPRMPLSTSHRPQTSPPSSRWPRGGSRGGRGSRGRGRGRGRGDDRSTRAPYPTPHMSANGRGGGRFARGSRGRGRGRDAPSASQRFYSRDSGSSRDYPYDDKDRRGPPPPRSRTTRSPPRSSRSPRPFPSRQPQESTRHSSHRRSRTMSKSPLRQKDDIIKLIPQCVMFAGGHPGEVDDHPLLSAYFSEHPGLHLAPELHVGMEDFLFKMSLMEVNKRKVRKRESAIAEAEIYKRDIIVCGLVSDGDHTNFWLPESEFVKVEPPMPVVEEGKDGEDADAQMAEVSDQATVEVTDSKDNSATAALAPISMADVARDGGDDTLMTGVDAGTENKTTDIVDNDDDRTNKAQAQIVDAEGAVDASDKVNESNDSGDVAPTSHPSSSEDQTSTLQEHQQQQQQEGESPVVGAGEDEVVDMTNVQAAPTAFVDDHEDSGEPMDVDDSGADVPEEQNGDGDDSKTDQLAATSPPATETRPKISLLTVVFGIDHALRADSDSKSNYDFLPVETLDNTRVVIVQFGCDSQFGEDPEHKLSSADDARKVFERLLTTGPLKKQSFRGVPAWDLDPQSPRSFQMLFPKVKEAQIQFYEAEKDHDQVENLREENVTLKKSNASLKKSLDSSRAKVEKYEKMVSQMMDLCKSMKK